MNKHFLTQTGVSLSRLESLSKIIADGGVTAAAAGDPSTQSKYSKQMSDLERVFGKETLFTPDGRGRKPTLVAKQIAAAYASFESAVNDIVSASQGQASVIKIGAGDSVFKWMLLQKVPILEGRHPSVSFELQNLRTQTVIEGIQSGEIDLGIAAIRRSVTGVSAVPLRRMEFGLYFHRETFGECDMREVLKRGKLLGLDGQGSYVRNCHEQLQKFGCPEQFWLTFSSLPMVADSMIQSKASAFLPMEMADAVKDGFGVISTDDMHSFSRSYNLLLSEHNLPIREKVGEVAETLKKVIN